MFPFSLVTFNIFLILVLTLTNKFCLKLTTDTHDCTKTYTNTGSPHWSYLFLTSLSRSYTKHQIIHSQAIFRVPPNIQNAFRQILILKAENAENRGLCYFVDCDDLAEMSILIGNFFCMQPYLMWLPHAKWAKYIALKHILLTATLQHYSKGILGLEESISGCICLDTLLGVVLYIFTGIFRNVFRLYFQCNKNLWWPR